MHRAPIVHPHVRSGVSVKCDFGLTSYGRAAWAAPRREPAPYFVGPRCAFVCVCVCLCVYSRVGASCVGRPICVCVPCWHPSGALIYNLKYVFSGLKHATLICREPTALHMSSLHRITGAAGRGGCGGGQGRDREWAQAQGCPTSLRCWRHRLSLPAPRRHRPGPNRGRGLSVGRKSAEGVAYKVV